MSRIKILLLIFSLSGCSTINLNNRHAMLGRLNSSYRYGSVKFLGFLAAPLLVRKYEHLDSLSDTDPSHHWLRYSLDSMQKIEAARNRLLNVHGQRTKENTLDVYNDIRNYLWCSIGPTYAMTFGHPSSDIRKLAGELREEGSYLEQRIWLDREIYQALQEVPLDGVDDQTKYWLKVILAKCRLEGVEKDEKTREELAQLRKEITQLEEEFEQNLTDDIRYLAVKESDLKGLPKDYIDRHLLDAKNRNLQLLSYLPQCGPFMSDAHGFDLNQELLETMEGGIQISTSRHDRSPFMIYAEDSSIREKLWRLGHKRCYRKNKKVLLKILKKRHKYATLLGHASYADYAINETTQMIGNPKEAKKFIDAMSEIGLEASKREQEQILAYRNKFEACDELKIWDYSFWNHRYKAEKFGKAGINEKIREYFPFEQTKESLLKLTAQMYGFRYERIQDDHAWHPSIESYAVYNSKTNEQVANIDLDLHPRGGKQNHATYVDLVHGVKGKQLCQGALSCNFQKPDENNSALMEFRSVVRFFHEFGHLAHEILSQHPQADFSGADSVQHDFVEAPSQMLERWIRLPEVLQQFAKHYQTGEPIPLEYIEYLQKSADFGLGDSTSENCFVAALSLAYHTQDPNDPDFDLDRIERETLEKRAPSGYNPGEHRYPRISHLVHPKYCATYLTYLFSKVIGEDLFSRFMLHGGLDPTVCEEYIEEILKPGGTKPTKELIKNFLGRPFNSDAYIDRLQKSSGG